MNRRSFIQAGLCAAAATMTPLATAIAEYKKYEKRIPIGLELYSLRDVINHDTFPKYLKWVAETGFEVVEFAGYHGYDNNPKELRKILDDVGLKAASTHVGFDAIKGDNLKRTAEIANELGFSYLIVPGGLEGRIRESIESNKRAADEMNECAEKAAEFGIAQIDIGWCDHANTHGSLFTPEQTLKLLAGRCKSLHIKSNNVDVKGCVVGDSDDHVDWKSVFEAAHEYGGTEYFIVEQEQWKVSSCDSAKECIENLKKMGW